MSAPRIQTTPSVPLDRRARLFQAGGLAVVSSLACFLLQPRIGIRDADSFAYLIGASSMASGNGYRDLSGSELNHWPPGYSLLLMLFPDPLLGATIINYCSLAGAVGLLYLLLLKSGWEWPAATAFSAAMGFGFFRLLANIAKPDILTYALFLLGVLLYRVPKGWGALAAYCCWAILTPLKLIAIVFTPAAIVLDAVSRRFRASAATYFHWSIGGVLWALSVGSTFLFNYLTLGRLLSPSHAEATSATPLHAIAALGGSVFRQFLWNWHGAIRTPSLLIACVLTLAVAMAAIASLRVNPAEWKSFQLAMIILLFSGLLLFVRSYEPTTRLLGYGLLAAFLGFRPVRWGNRLWVGYGLLSVGFAVANALSVNALGTNDPRYAQMALESQRLRLKQPVGTNSFHILDIHIRVPTVSIENGSPLDPYQSILLVTLLRYDGVAGPVWPMDRPGKEWCESGSVTGATLFERCAREVTLSGGK